MKFSINLLEHPMQDQDPLEITIFEPDDYIVINLPDDNLIDLTMMGNQDADAFEKRVIELTNYERSQKSLPPLKRNKNLSDSALLYSLEMAEHHFISHTGFFGSKLAERVLASGYHGWRYIGENLAMGYLTPESVVQGWMESEGHRKNMLSVDYTEIGVGYVMGEVPTTNGGFSKGGYWTQHFGKRMRLFE